MRLAYAEYPLLHSAYGKTPLPNSHTQGCVTLQLRHTDYDALCDPRAAMMLLPSEGQVGPPAVVELVRRFEGCRAEGRPARPGRKRVLWTML